MMVLRLFSRTKLRTIIDMNMKHLEDDLEDASIAG